VSPSVAVEREPVHHEGVAQQVEMLPLVSDAVRPAEPERVIKVPVDRLGVAPARIEPLEVRIARGDGSDVLGSVQLPGSVIRCAMQPDSDDAGTEVLREAVVVVQRNFSDLSRLRWVRTRASSV
jgi:hypothetical protein